MVSKIEIVKKLLKENLEELNKNTSIDGLTIDFENNKFYVYDKNNKNVLKGDLTEIDTDFESQKEFVLNVANKIYAFAKDYNEIDCEDFEKLIEPDNELYYDILGWGDIYKSRSNFINLKLDKSEFEYGDDSFVDCCIYEIKEYLNEEKIRVILYYDEYKRKAGFYVDGMIFEDCINLAFIEDPDDIERLEKSDEIDENLIQRDMLSLYYKLHINKSVKKFIKDMIKNR